MNKKISPSLGILDWGIGGLGLYKFIKRDRPDIPVIYWSDSGEIPYGKLSAAALGARVRNVIYQLANRGATHIAIACNAASTVLPDIQRHIGTDKEFPQTTGVIEHGIMAAAARHGSIGIIGGGRTIRSGIYRRGLQNPETIIHQRIAQPLSAHIEAGTSDSEDFHLVLRRIMKPLRDIETLVLACTHYPAITDRFQELAPSALIIDPAEHMARWILANWNLADRNPPRGSGADIFLTTGDPIAMKSAARSVFGVTIDRAERVGIS
ncbi:MAG: aspartate/glutamate racemase family protein [Candidatus Kapaibacterium sp.]